MSACKSKSQETAPATPPPNAAAPAKPPALAPGVDDSLSFVEKEGDQCKWVRLDAVAGTRKAVFTFAGPCQLTQLAWSHDGRKGAVLQSFEDERPPRAWTVDLVTGQGTALTLPGVGRTTELGFDPQGRPIALVAHHELPNTQPPQRVEENGQATFVFEGQKYPIDVQDGEPGLAHAYRREGAAWKRVETRVTSYGWDLAGETQVLELVKSFGPNTKLEAQAGLESENASDQEAAALEKSAPGKQAQPSGAGGEEEEAGSWARFNTSGGPVYYKEEQVEHVIPSLPLRWTVGDKLVEPEKLALPEDSAISLATRGNVLLVTSNEAVRLYDVKQKKHLVSLSGVYRPGFWPRPEATSGKPTASAGDKESPKALSMKLNDSQAAFDFLEQSGMKLEEGKEYCAELAENGTLGALVKKARADATDWSVQCDPNTDAKTWACKAEFTRSGGDEDSEFSIQLQYSVDDTTRTIQPGSLVCLMAG